MKTLHSGIKLFPSILHKTGTSDEASYEYFHFWIVQQYHKIMVIIILLPWNKLLKMKQICLDSNKKIFNLEISSRFKTGWTSFKINNSQIKSGNRHKHLQIQVTQGLIWVTSLHSDTRHFIPTFLFFIESDLYFHSFNCFPCTVAICPFTWSHCIADLFGGGVVECNAVIFTVALHHSRYW